MPDIPLEVDVHIHSLRLPGVLCALLAAIGSTACLGSMAAPPDSAAAFTWTHGRNDYVREMDGVPRQFVVHIPAGYNAREPVPLLFMLHGASGNGDRFHRISGWVAKAEAEGFIAVFPTALAYPIRDTRRSATRWSGDNLADAIIPGTPITDDVVFLRELVALLRRQFSIDERRIYIVGFSNGGGFVRSRSVPEMADVFAAAATAGGVGLPAPRAVTGERLLPLFSLIGTLDDAILQAMGEATELPISAERFTTHPQIGRYVSGMLQTLRLGPEYREVPHPPDHNLIIFADDRSGQGNEHRILIAKDMGHVFPNGRNNPHGLVGADIIWNWFLEVGPHPSPGWPGEARR
jgi:polyhydroxybutyrate depolymerase